METQQQQQPQSGFSPELLQRLSSGLQQQQQQQAPAATTAAPPVNEDPTAAPAPTISATVTEEGGEEEGPGFLGTLADMGSGVVGGAFDSLNETTDFARSAVDWVDDKVGTDLIQEGDEWKPFPELEENVTGFGKATRGISQFITGFVGAGKVLKAAKLMQGASKTMMISRGMVQGGMTDAVAFDPHEERLSDLIEEFPELSNPVTRYLEAKDTDSDAEGRFKNTLEGLGLGAMTESLFVGIKAMRKLKNAKTIAEKTQIQEETATLLEGSVKDTDEQVAETVAESIHTKGKVPGEDARVVKEGEQLHDEFAESAVAPRSVINDAGDEAGAEFTAEAATGASGREYVGDKTAHELYKIISDAKNGDEALEEITSHVNFRTWLFEHKDQEQALKGIAKALYDKKLVARGPQSHDVLYREAVEDLSKAGFNTDQIIAKSQNIAKEQLPEITRFALEAKITLGGLIKESTRIATLIDAGRHDFKDLVIFHALHNDVQDLHLAVNDIGTGFGRALSSRRKKVDLANLPDGKVKVGPEAEEVATEAAERKIRPEDVKDMTEEQIREYMTKKGLTPDKLKKLARIVKNAEGDPNAISRIMNKVTASSWMDVHTEYWYNCILSGYRTQAVNMLGNAMKAAILPSEKIIGGWMTGDKTLMREGVKTYAGLMKFTTDAFQLAGKALKSGNNILDSGHSVIDAPTHQISYENIKRLWLSKRLGTTKIADLDAAQLSPMGEVLAQGIGHLGKVIRLPSRFLMTGDEFFKQLNFRADLYSRLHTQAFAKFGKNADPGQMARWVEQEMDTYFENGGRAIDFEQRAGQMMKQDGGIPGDVLAEMKSHDMLSKKSMLYAQDATWTRSLEYGYGHGFQKFAAEHPSFRMIIPFIRTPTNLIRDFVAHTPGLAHVTRRYKEAMAQGGESAAMAKGQLATGSMIWMTAVGAASSGSLTGAPPKDKKLNERLRATGWQPWSIKVGDKYIPYNRLDPYGMLLGMAADYTKLWQDRGGLKQEEIAMGMIVALANNVTSKTYLRGVTDVVSALTDPDRNMMRVLKGRVASYSPFSSLQRNIRQDFTDDSMREVRSILDYTMNQMPGYSDDLPARRDWVTGQPVDYTGYYGQDKPDPVMDELARLGKNILGSPGRRQKGLELSSQQYSRFIELHGTVKVQGKTLYDRLKDTFESDKYDLKREHTADPVIGEPGPRADFVNKIIRAHRKVAMSQLLREDPSLLMEVETARRKTMASKKGQLTQSNQDQMQNLLNF